MSNYFYIVNVEHGGVLTVAGGSPVHGMALIVQTVIKPRVNYQLWYVDDPARSHIRSFKSDFVLQKEAAGPTGGYWVNLASRSASPSQLWSYDHNNSWIANYETDCMLAIWGFNAVMCAPPIGRGRVSQTVEPAEPVAAPVAQFYKWQLKIVGTDDEE